METDDRDLLRRCFGRLALDVAARRAERAHHAEAREAVTARLRRAGVRVGDVQVRFMDRALLCAVFAALRRTVADGRAHRDREAWRVVVAQLTARVAQLEAAGASKAAEAG